MRPALPLAALLAATLSLAACASLPNPSSWAALQVGRDGAPKSLAPPHAPIVEGRTVRVVPHPDQLALLESDDPQLAANKRLVFDYWRSVVNGGRVEVLRELVAEDYIEHSPTKPTGRAALEAQIVALAPRREIVPERIEHPVVTMIAEGDFVLLALVDERPEPTGAGPDGSATYTTTIFHLFRIEGGRIAEHWDSVMLNTPIPLLAPEDGGAVMVTGVEGTEQIALTESPDVRLANNKRLVFDLWRHIPEAGREETAELYLDPIYIQHNPNAATGREGFREYFSRRPDRPIETSYKTPIVALIAEGDLVAQALAEEREIPGRPGETYSLTHFDLFRIENGRAVEHWDNAGKGDMPPPRPGDAPP